MKWNLASSTREQIANAKAAFNTLVTAFHAQPASPIQEDSSVIAARAETSARRPDSLPVPPALPAGQSPDQRASERRSRSRCTRVENRDSTAVSKQVSQSRAAGDSRAASVAVKPCSTYQPLEMSGDGSPRSHGSPPAVDKHSGRRYGECGLRLPLFDGHDWPDFLSQFERCAKHYRWSDSVKAVRLAASIVGKA